MEGETVNFGRGDGSGYGNGRGDGSGYGNGSSGGYGDGDGNGYGNGYGNGSSSRFVPSLAPGGAVKIGCTTLTPRTWLERGEDLARATGVGESDIEDLRALMEQLVKERSLIWAQHG